MDIVLVFIDSQLWHKKLKQQNLLSVSGDKKINQTDTNTRDLDKKDCKVYKLQRKVKHLITKLTIVSFRKFFSGRGEFVVSFVVVYPLQVKYRTASK